ncbi:hypothetical protein GcM3_03845 [Golovinomyces cichoracearum]|uniref:Uncharacterized protein n=1 Tax=Golovinomyces cichoracearum TaxID=62708 RepID=A0A420I631_9PEZI|nr:hypothetical protein GcM3_03845 [Golovinomyces cichoracearum]
MPSLLNALFLIIFDVVSISKLLVSVRLLSSPHFTISAGTLLTLLWRGYILEPVLAPGGVSDFFFAGVSHEQKIIIFTVAVMSNICHG